MLNAFILFVGLGIVVITFLIQITIGLFVIAVSALVWILALLLKGIIYVKDKIKEFIKKRRGY